MKFNKFKWNNAIKKSIELWHHRVILCHCVMSVYMVSNVHTFNYIQVEEYS